MTRIYVNTKLFENYLLNITESLCHYLRTVLRLKIGDHFRVFNDIDGEFMAQITNITQNIVSARLVNILRKITVEPEVVLGISLIKSDRMLNAIDMAVQLGVTKIIPLIAERSQFRTVSAERLLKRIIESTEQSERLVPPILMPLVPLSFFLQQNNCTIDTILYANEHESNNNTLLKSVVSWRKVAVIIGPEGGFSQNEHKMFLAHPNALSISLGPNILRTETAVAACLAQIRLFTS